MSSSYHDLPMPEIYSNTNTTELPVIVVFSNFSCVVWTENISYVFEVKPPFSNSFGIVWTLHEYLVLNLVYGIRFFRLERSDITKWRHKIDPTL